MQEDRQVLGLVNPVLDSDYEDDDTLETERGFLVFSILLGINGVSER